MHYNTVSAHDLDETLARLARRALLTNILLAMGGPTSLLPDFAGSLAATAVRALGLSQCVPWYAGTRARALTGIDRSTLSLYAHEVVGPSALLVRQRPARSPLASGVFDGAVVALALRAHDVVTTAWTGGPSSGLTPVLQRLIAAVRRVDSLWQDRATWTPVAGITRRPAAHLVDELRPSIDPQEFAEFCVEVERNARRQRGVPEDVQLPIASAECGWCGVSAGQRHTTIECIPHGEELLLTLGDCGDPEMVLLQSQQVAQTSAPAEVREYVWGAACGACGRPISLTGHCGC